MQNEIVSFDIFDRCDRCGSRALSVAKKEGLADLMFCWHHKSRHEDALLNSGWTVHSDVSTYEAYRQPVAV